jgi:hypothetical protein
MSLKSDPPKKSAFSFVRSHDRAASMLDSAAVLPVIDIEPFLKDPNSEQAAQCCAQIASVLKETSCLIIKDPRVYVSYLSQCDDY